jgi:IS5 family transposase
MTWAERIRTQRPNDKSKLYALHAPDAEGISEGKSRNPMSSASRPASP